MRKSLLLVDDEVALLDTMKELLLLEDANLEITTATNGLDALQYLITQDFDCVVSDVKMPKMDGLTLIKKTRECDIEVPFIFYSGHGCQTLADRAIELGATALVCKPHFMEVEAEIFKTLRYSETAEELLA